MGLIKCPSCGRDISDKTNNCIHCGYEMRTNNVNSYTMNSNINSEKQREVWYCCYVCGKESCYHTNDRDFVPKCTGCNSKDMRCIGETASSLDLFRKGLFFICPIYGFLACLCYKDNSPKRATQAFGCAIAGAITEIIIMALWLFLLWIGN